MSRDGSCDREFSEPIETAIRSVDNIFSAPFIIVDRLLLPRANKMQPPTLNSSRTRLRRPSALFITHRDFASANSRERLGPVVCRSCGTFFFQHVDKHTNAKASCQLPFVSSRGCKLNFLSGENGAMFVFFSGGYRRIIIRRVALFSYAQID